MSDAVSDTWAKLKEWPELILERLEGAGVAGILSFRRTTQLDLLLEQSIARCPVLR